MQAAICVDDYGVAVYRCHYTFDLVWADVAAFVGATLPGVRARYVVSPGNIPLAAHKAQGIRFHESEANCNTCFHLGRVAHAKTPSKFMHGKCRAQHPHHESNPYFGRMDGEVMIFHPEDWMGMPCYQSRWKPLHTGE